MDSPAVRHVPRPDPMILRDQLLARAMREPPSPCPHPMSGIDQYIDEEPGREDRPTNLFHCRACNGLLILSDVHGKPASDG